MGIKEKVYKLSRCAVEALLLIAWAGMMFFPAWAETKGFRVFLAVSIGCAVVYSIAGKTFFPGRQSAGKAEKTAAVVLIAALFLKLLFF